MKCSQIGFKLTKFHMSIEFYLNAGFEPNLDIWTHQRPSPLSRAQMGLRGVAPATSKWRPPLGLAQAPLPATSPIRVTSPRPNLGPWSLGQWHRTAQGGVAWIKAECRLLGHATDLQTALDNHLDAVEAEAVHPTARELAAASRGWRPPPDLTLGRLAAHYKNPPHSFGL